jgi:4-amino-4-deoxy-L-arabinose transferase-like glycosyltransferase
VSIGALERRRPSTQLLLIGAVAAGAVTRSIPVVSAGFPLHDGGLFYSMVGDLRASHFLLPAFTSYNGGDIPFAYPPLSLYLAAGLNAFGLDTLLILRWLPLLISVITVPLVYLVVRKLLTPAHGIGAAFAFALMPSAFDWMIVGGGLTRALGLVFGLLAIHEAILVARGEPRWSGIAAGVTGGLTLLSHPYAAAFAFTAGGLMVAWFARSRRAWTGVAVALITAIAIVSPWIATIVSMHGWGPILAAGGSRTQGGIPLASLLFQDVTGAAFSVFLGFGLLGVATQVARRKYFLPVWLLVTAVLVGGGGWVMLTIPLSGLMSVAVVDVVFPALALLKVGERGVVRAGAVLIGAGLLACLGVGYVNETPLHPLPANDRRAMAWIAENIRPGATFAVITGEPWALDTASEWFPVLAQRMSLGTAQGYEWTSQWNQRRAEAERLQSCAASATAGCLEEWVALSKRSPDYIYVEKSQPQSLDGAECCAALRQTLAKTFSTTYEGPGATIFAWPGS